MTDTAKRIASDLAALGVEKCDTLLVHTSLHSLGSGVEASDVIDGLLLALGEEGTLMLPALSYCNCNASKPYFDYYETQSNIGYLPEYFRTRVEGVLRSVCPTHSCCAKGKNAHYLTSGHILDTTPCGANSPFRRLAYLAGKILFIGCTMRPNTSMHAVEELINPDYLFGDDVRYTLRDELGVEHTAVCRAHDFRGVAQRYERIAELLDGDAHRTGRVLSADCDLVKAVPMWVTALGKYHEDPHYFIDRID